MSIFDETERGRDDPADYLVSAFDYLNISGRPEAARVRALLDEFLDHYPLRKRDALIGRLRSRNDILHRSAFFELFLHELLIRRGFRIVAIEPEMANGRSPDFLVDAPDGSRFVLEATLAQGRDGAEASADRRMREALQAIDSVQSPDFFLHVHTRGAPSQPIKVSRLRQAVQQFVDSLNYEAAVRGLESNNAPELFQYEENGASFHVEAMPKHLRRPGGRSIASRNLPGGFIYPHEPIKSALKGKAGRYGSIGVPFIVAVNSLEEFARDVDAIDALFGTMSVVIANDGSTRPGRNLDGFWCGPGGPRHTRVSAVISTERLGPWDLGQRRARLVINPWATHPISPDIQLGIEVRYVIDGRIHTIPGVSFAEIFSLSEGWPE